MADHEHVRLDDEDPDKRNEALVIENEHLREEVAHGEMAVNELASIMSMMYGVQEMGLMQPGEARQLYTAIDSAIEAFLRPMDQALRQNKQLRDRVIASLWSSNRGLTAFRFMIDGDEQLKNAALDPYTNTIDIWTASIWKFLYANVFREQAVSSFYALDSGATGPNASDHMRHLDEILDLMQQADPPVFGEYSRRLWRRQGLAAIFRTSQFDWVAARRNASIDRLANQMWNIFSGFTRLINEHEGRGLVREIVSAAVRLNEHMMIEADDIWTIPETDTTIRDFYTRPKEFDLKPVGTMSALRDNTPLDTISDRLSSQELQNRVSPLCIIAPALRYRSFDMAASDYDNPVNLIKPRILVSLKQAAPAGGQQAPAAAPPEEPIFYVLARSMGPVN